MGAFELVGHLIVGILVVCGDWWCMIGCDVGQLAQY